MAPPGPDDGERATPPIDARLLRPVDMVDLRLEAPNCHLEPVDGAAEIVAEADARLILHFPTQHIGERAWDAETPGAPTPNVSGHRAAGPSRVVLDLPKGTRIPYSLEGVLAAANTLPLRVPANATPAPDQAGPPPPTGIGPEPPKDDETAIEVPYRLVVSPSERGSFQHRTNPVGPGDDASARTRVELWRTHLTVRPSDGHGTDGADGGAVPDAPVDDTQRIVRAVYTRDFEHGNPLDPGVIGPQSLDPRDRRAIVMQTYGGEKDSAATPLQVRELALSSLGAWVDWSGHWDDVGLYIADYRHLAAMGRDAYVRVAYPGFLFPFGHRCILVKVTERRIDNRSKPVAYLWQRTFIIIRQPTRTYTDLDNPFRQVTVGPLVTPDLDKPPVATPFVPRRGGTPFPFNLTTVDQAGVAGSFAAPLVFVRAHKRETQISIENESQVDGQYHTPGPLGPINHIQGRGQSVAMAAPVKAGDTAVEVTHLVFDGEIDRVNVTSRPFVRELRAIVPAMRHLSPQAPAVDLVYAQPYLASGLAPRLPDQPPTPGAPNPGEMLLALKSPPAAVDFAHGSERSGGFISPNLAVRGVSRALGAVGDDGTAPGGLDAGKFDPASFLQGALPKLFGLFSLLDILDATGLLDRAPSFVSDALDAVASLVTEARRLQAALDAATTRLQAELDGGPHDGAKAVTQAAKDALAAQAGGLSTALQQVIDAVTALPGNPDSAHVDGLTGALGDLATRIDPLLQILGQPGFPAAVRASLQKPLTALKTLAAIKDEAAKLVEFANGILQPGSAVTARMEWHPRINPWGLGAALPNIFKPNHPDTALTLAIEVRASATAPPVVDILAELVDFELNLIGDGDAALMQLTFQRIGFHSGSSGKPEVDVVFGGMAFLGPLAFVDTLRKMIPFDGFSDPPYVDVAPEGVTAGFDIALPSVGVGVFSLENIALGADARVPFLGDAVTVGFHFCSKDSPFRLTVMCIGGGGWVVLRASPKGLVLLEVGLEATACLSIDLGVASGSVSVAVGVYLRLEADKGSLTAYFRIRGEVDVLGLISASITLELSLTYQFDTGKLIGRASLVIEVEVLFFSASVEVSCERRLAGSKGDPTMIQIMPPAPDGTNADWTEYCDAFAPLPALVPTP
ncbi:hypothetical protein [Lapillicoccus sp.]|uniref:hypothetical protein n=1 Tax=Lapillicoccus sp. TaxID=1909287 RepID=UPI0027C65BF5|nr:hypothetical protein [Actinomycetota bacterium]